MSTARKRLVQVGGFGLAAVLLFLALRGVDFARVGTDLASARWGWFLPLAVVALASHALRAWRWTLFLDTLPRTDGSRDAVPVSSAFAAVMVGYMANYAAPRLGEFVRTANVATRHKLRFSAVLGTVAVERVLDLVTMALAFLSVPLVLSGRLGAMEALWRDAVSSWLARIESHALGSAIVLLVSVAGAAWLAIRIRRGAGGRIGHLVRSFGGGIAALARTPHRSTLIVTTLAIWALYGIMAWIPFAMFSFDTAHGITLAHAWAIMLIGALGVVVPSPGGIGSYHWITIQALVLMFGFATSEAATYAIVTHAGQLVLYVVTGFVAMLAQGARWSDLVMERRDD